jgi:hypothetical protein
MYAFEQDVPIDAAIYARIIAALGDEPPHGLIAHVAIERPDGHLSYLDVWETKADCDAFTEGRLHPVVGAALRAAGIRAEEPPRREVNVIDAWGADLERRASLKAGA